MKPSTNPPTLRAKRIRSTTLDTGTPASREMPDVEPSTRAPAQSAPLHSTPSRLTGGAAPDPHGSPEPADGAGQPFIASVSAEEGLRYYAAIIGRQPTLDPEAPDVLPGMSAGEEAVRGWAEDLSRVLRDEIARTLQMRLNRRPTWREIMEVMTASASRRLGEARKRLSKKDAA